MLERAIWYLAGKGQQSIVMIKLTGGRRADFKAANELGGFKEKPNGYTWHHVDDFDPESGTSSLQLVETTVHIAASHRGSVAQYEKFYGVKYRN